MARPKSENPHDIIVKVRMNEEERKELEKFCEKTGYSISDTIRWALERFYEAEEWRLQLAPLMPPGWCKRLQSCAEEKDDEYIYTSEAASIMNCSEMLIRKYCQTGVIKAHKNKNDKTGRWMILKKDLMVLKRSEKSPAFTRPRRK